MNLIKKALSLGVISLMSLFIVGHASATGTPAFNIFKDVAGIGDESDFIRIGVDGSGGNTVEACEAGKIVDFWIYVHNGASAFNNGTNNDGPGVAHNTTLKVNVDQNQFKKSHNISAVIDSNETTPITDGATVTCAGEEVALEYLGVTGFNSTDQSGNFKIWGDPINGAQIGFENGVVPGCWEFRGRVNVQVRIKKKPVVVVEKKCEAVNVSKSVVKPGESVTVTATGSAKNAAIQGFIFTVKNSAGAVVETKEVVTSATTANYTFSQTAEGTYTVSASVKFADGNVTSANCDKTITVKTTPTPTVIPDTGVGSMLGALSGVTIAGAVMHRAWTIRRATR